MIEGVALEPHSFKARSSPSLTHSESLAKEPPAICKMGRWVREHVPDGMGGRALAWRELGAALGPQQELGKQERPLVSFVKPRLRREGVPE